MICIADDPNKDGFEVVSYHTDLEPYMARGRALKAEGKSFTERRDIREKERDAVKARRPIPPGAIDTTPHTSSPSISKWKSVSMCPALEAPPAHER